MRQISLREFRSANPELRRAMAKASLRENWRLAKDAAITDEEIDREIEQVRKSAGKK